MAASLDLLTDLVSKARKAGADSADAVMFKSAHLGLRQRLGKPEMLERSESQDLGLRVMVGGMVETRLGMSAAAALAACFPRVLADLDTAWLLREERFVGGYEASGEIYVVGHGHGHGVALKG